MTIPNHSRRIPNAQRLGWSTFRTDMFGRTKISEPYTLFDSQHRYKESGDFSDETTGTATVSYLPNESTALLTIGTASGDKITRESKKVFPYQPGKSLQVMQTFVFAPPKAGLRQRAGYFSRQNGVYLEQDGFDAYIVIRSFTTGQVVNLRVPQSEWNVDRLDGTGPTDLVIDLTKAQIFITEYEWLGAGSIRIGFMIDGVFVTAHQFNHANLISTVYITTATLPVRYEIENTAATSSSSAMRQICVSVLSNGGYQRTTEDWTASRTNTVNISSNFYPIVAIRLASGRTDAVITPTGLSVLPIAQGNYEYALVRNPTAVTGGTWLTHTASTGNVEYNISATAMTGGSTVFEGLLSSSNQAQGTVNLGNADVVRVDLQLGRTNADTPVSDVLVLAVKSLGGTQSCIGSLSWSDLV
jgi:hypothetical protein